MFHTVGIVMLAVAAAVARPSSEVDKLIGYPLVLPNDIPYMPYFSAPLEKLEHEGSKEPAEKMEEENAMSIPEGPMLPPLEELKLRLSDESDAAEGPKIDVPKEAVEPLSPAEPKEEKPASVLSLEEPAKDSSAILGFNLPFKPPQLFTPWAWNWSNILPFKLPSLPLFPKVSPRARVHVYGV